ncbi:hypothetical protein NE172_08965 [Clostridium botulinum]|uniref:Uncharacterized protein n=1 Tax=Clostridium botulinum TaxID=1491 RepID=A0A6B4JM22_CLOBO|nr:hypothetical protein [Clostridium botulinum]EES48696.1 SMC4 protein, putative [Clostridium botulinum E1 str. 'BoNT E Beluga']MBY6761473.1 hypothetical protein [Clostridium botulinum]MBY6920195.1 hypothetical protein [Clostridium botulinum]MCR1131086.1 hypothetical protein [Clostridium botulinum]NFJ58096.1 hypothetical protein [Clostridium botulinum]
MLEHQIKKFQNLLEKTEEARDWYNKNIEEIKQILEYIKNDISVKAEDNIDTIILKKYIEYGNMKDVQKYIDDLGYRIKTESYIGSRKYTAEDISQVVYPYEKGDEKPREVNADEMLKEVVKKMHLYIFNSSYGKLKVREFNK